MALMDRHGCRGGCPRLVRVRVRVRAPSHGRPEGSRGGASPQCDGVARHDARVAARAAGARGACVGHRDGARSGDWPSCWASSAGPRIVGSSTPPARRSRGSAISVSTSRHRRAEHETLVAGPDAGACGPSLAVAPARLILALDPRPIARLSLPRPRRSVARGDEERGGGRGWHALRGRGLGEIEQAVRLSRRCSSPRPTS